MKKAFTLVELLVCVAILAALLGLIAPAVVRCFHGDDQRTVEHVNGIPSQPTPVQPTTPVGGIPQH